MNPYDWRRHRPRPEIRRLEVDAVAEDLRQGGSGVLLAGRGMGKSVFLRQLRAELDRDPETRVALFPPPPPQLTVRAFLRDLANKLGVDLADPLDTHRIVEACLFASHGPRRIVLLYDEFGVARR